MTPECPICALHELADALGFWRKFIPATAFVLPMRGLPPRCAFHAKRGKTWLQPGWEAPRLVLLGAHDRLSTSTIQRWKNERPEGHA